jgi:hypothetical protein
MEPALIAISVGVALGEGEGEGEAETLAEADALAGADEEDDVATVPPQPARAPMTSVDATALPTPSFIDCFPTSRISGSSYEPWLLGPR